MPLNFIILNLNVIVLAVWAVFFIVVVLRFVRPEWACPLKFFSEKIWRARNISFSMLMVLAIGLHIFYGAFVTWGQYHTWSAPGNDLGKSFLSSPLSKEVPLPIVLEVLRPALEQPLGYFSYYVFGRIWLNIIILFALSGFFYSILKIWSFYRGGFLPHGPEILLVLMLISGYPGILVLVPFSFAVAFGYFGISYAIKLFTEIGLPKQYAIPAFLSSVRKAVSIVKCSPIYLEHSFMVATPLALLFGATIFSYF